MDIPPAAPAPTPPATSPGVAGGGSTTATSGMWANPATAAVAAVSALTATVITLIAAGIDVTATAAAPAAPPVVYDIDAATGPTAVGAVAEIVAPTVWKVTVTGADGGSSATAVAWDDAGHLVTNHHVVAGVDTVVVAGADGTAVVATVVGSDVRTDVAVLKVPAVTVAAEWTDTVPAVGDVVVAVGTPFGLGWSVSAGIVSSPLRTVGIVNGAVLHDVLQHDAPINPGNSGGALADTRGRIVGLNAAMFTKGGAGHGVGFAVPTTTVRRVADAIISTGAHTTGLFGVRTVDVQPSGARIVRVQPGGPAERAGITAGDVAVAVDGRPVESSADLFGRFGAARPGDTVTVTVVRGADTVELTVTVGVLGDQQWDVTDDTGGGGTDDVDRVFDGLFDDIEPDDYRDAFDGFVP